MDGDQFDRLTRRISAGTTRRALLAAAAVFAPAGVLERTTRAKKRRKKKKCTPPCGECQACVRKVCQSAADGTGCNGGTCSGGVCFGGGGNGNCTVANDHAVSLVTESTFQDQELRAVQTVQPFDDTGALRSQLDLTLGGAPLLTIATESAGGAVTVTVTYGEAFRGITRSRFTNDGTTITGEIDGRAIAPLSAAADPSAATFADGSPLPELEVDPQLVEAIAGILRQANQDAAGCDPARQGRAARVRARHAPGRKGSQATRSPGTVLRADPETAVACDRAYTRCQFDASRCLLRNYLELISSIQQCTIATFTYGVCAAARVQDCNAAATQCFQAARVSRDCCPVRCGGSDADPHCCETGETCLPDGSCGGPCVGLNVPCNARDVCCRGEVCATVEPQKGTSRCDTTVGAFVAQCCREAGLSCTNHCQCCHDLRCEFGLCIRLPTICHAVGESCADGEPCCAGAGACFGGRCCQGDGVACPQGCGAEADCQACCAGYCRGDGRCGPVGGCLEYGADCTTGAECCNNVPCTGPGGGGQGRCRYP